MTVILCTFQTHGGTLTSAATMSVNMLSGHLALDECYDESLPNSEYTDEFDTEVADINMKKNKRRKNKRNQELLGDKDSDETQDIPEEIEEDICNADEKDHDETEGLRLSPKPKRSKSPTVSKCKHTVSCVMFCVMSSHLLSHFNPFL